MQLFREQFLGKSNFGKNSIIENEDDINFEYDAITLKLIATTNKPLKIRNHMLGYKVTYELLDFEVIFYKLSMSSNHVLKSYTAGLSKFEDIENSTKIINNRKKCYQGSQLQFFRNLANNLWDKKNFLLFVGSFQDNPEKHFIINQEEEYLKIVVKKQIKPLITSKFIAQFNLLYKKKQQSKIIFETDTFYIDKFGNFSDNDKITFSGKLSKQRVGDMLPLNFTSY